MKRLTAKVRTVRGVIAFLVVSGVLLPCTHACDTWVALGDVTQDGVVMLGKNSDRPTFDCQPLMFYPRTEWAAGSEIDLGRITIPQVLETYATLGSSPYWCWGYEEGINEYGVAIGNEGVWTKPLVESMRAYQEGEDVKLGPTGMDMIRLGLERARSAREAVEVITELLETYGQFGSGVPATGVMAAYDNSFMIADPTDAWILETAGTHWVARQIPRGSASISNKISIGTIRDLESWGIMDHAVRKGWWQEGGAAFDFTEAYSADTPNMRERQERAQIREQRSCALLEDSPGRIDLAWMKQIARDRGTDPSIDLDQTASSCVAVLTLPDEVPPVFWWCPARPSNSCYVPFFVHGSRLPETVSAAGTYGKRVVPPSEAEADSFTAESYWWLFRDLTDMVAVDWDRRYPVARDEFDQLETEFEEGLDAVLTQARLLRQAGEVEEAAARLDSYTALCVEKSVEKVNDLRQRFAQEVLDVPAEYRPYVGTYIGNFATFNEAEFEVKIQNGHLAVDVPGQMVFELNEPDEEGRWYFKITPLVAVSFRSDETGRISSMTFHQTSQLPRKHQAQDSGEQEDTESLEPGTGSPATPQEAAPEGLGTEAAGEIPEVYRRYTGTYTVPMGTREVGVLFEDGRLMLALPDQAKIPLKEPDAEGRWYFAIDPRASVSFTEDEAGKVTKLNIHQMFELPKAQ